MQALHDGRTADLLPALGFNTALQVCTLLLPNVMQAIGSWCLHLSSCISTKQSFVDVSPCFCRACLELALTLVRSQICAWERSASQLHHAAVSTSLGCGQRDRWLGICSALNENLTGGLCCRLRVLHHTGH